MAEHPGSGDPYPKLNTDAESAKQLIHVLSSLQIEAIFIDVSDKDDQRYFQELKSLAQEQKWMVNCHSDA